MKTQIIYRIVLGVCFQFGLGASELFRPPVHFPRLMNVNAEAILRLYDLKVVSHSGFLSFGLYAPRENYYIFRTLRISRFIVPVSPISALADPRDFSKTTRAGFRATRISML